jgi:hypothetical protein
MILDLPTISELQALFNSLKTMDKDTMLALGYCFYLYCVMDGTNHPARSRRRCRR